MSPVYWTPKASTLEPFELVMTSEPEPNVVPPRPTLPTASSVSVFGPSEIVLKPPA